MAFDARVHPVVPANEQRILVTLCGIERVFRALRRYWNSIQVGHRGRYSVERLLAFQDYYQRTSPSHAFMVCLLALLPAFTVAILVELIPLKPPGEGWKASYAFWIRLFASSLPIAFGGVYQVKEVLEPGVIFTTGIIATAVGSCTCYVALTMLVAALWKFPIPFGYVLTVGPFVAFYMVFFLLSIGPRVLANSPALRQQIFSQMLVIAAQGMLAIAYPTFGAIFNQLSGHEQAAFVFVLPIIKFCIKQFIATVSAHLHEFVGPTVVLSVDVCNVLYVAICVLTAVSPITSGLLIASDAFFVLMALRSIYYQSNVSHARQRALSINSKLLTNLNYIHNLRALLREAFQSSDPLGAAGVPIRIRAPFPLPISNESTAFLNDLELTRRRYSIEDEPGKDAHGESKSTESSIRTPQRKSSKSTTTSKPRSSRNSQELLEVDSGRTAPTRKLSAPTSGSNSTSCSKHSRATSRAELYHYQVVVANVQDSLQALFHSEYVVLAEFIECVIPMLYGVYLAVLYHHAYYRHTGITR